MHLKQALALLITDVAAAATYDPYRNRSISDLVRRLEVARQDANNLNGGAVTYVPGAFPDGWPVAVVYNAVHLVLREWDSELAGQQDSEAVVRAAIIGIENLSWTD